MANELKDQPLGGFLQQQATEVRDLLNQPPPCWNGEALIIGYENMLDFHAQESETWEEALAMFPTTSQDHLIAVCRQSLIALEQQAYFAFSRLGIAPINTDDEGKESEWDLFMNSVIARAHLRWIVGGSLTFFVAKEVENLWQPHVQVLINWAIGNPTRTDVLHDIVQIVFNQTAIDDRPSVMFNLVEVVWTSFLQVTQLPVVRKRVSLYCKMLGNHPHRNFLSQWGVMEIGNLLLASIREECPVAIRGAVTEKFAESLDELPHLQDDISSTNESN